MFLLCATFVSAKISPGMEERNHPEPGTGIVDFFSCDVCVFKKGKQTLLQNVELQK